jgi:hypothetical protein
MTCFISCMFSAVCILGMIYFYNFTYKSRIVKEFKESLSQDLNLRYDKITKERRLISYKGYTLGFILSIVILLYNRSYKMKPIPLVCTVVTISFVTNYLYYILSPKSDWLLNHMTQPDEIKSWLLMYKEMQFNYHMGFLLGILGVGMFAFAFRC